MKTQAFWETVQQMAMITTNSCRVSESAGQSTDEFEQEQIRLLKRLCERQLIAVPAPTHEARYRNSGYCSASNDISREEESRITPPVKE